FGVTVQARERPLQAAVRRQQPAVPLVFVAARQRAEPLVAVAAALQIVADVFAVALAFETQAAAAEYTIDVGVLRRSEAAVQRRAVALRNAVGTIVGDVAVVVVVAKAHAQHGIVADALVDTEGHGNVVRVETGRLAVGLERTEVRRT